MSTRVTERPRPSPTTLGVLYESARCDSPVVADQRPLGSAHRQPRTASRCGGSEARRPAACQEASSPPRRASGRSFWRRGVCLTGQAVPVGSTLQHPTASPVRTLPYLLGSSGSVEISSRITVETSRALELPGPGGERATWPGIAVLRALRPQESRHGARIGFPRAHASCLSVGGGRVSAGTPLPVRRREAELRKTLGFGLGVLPGGAGSTKAETPTRSGKLAEVPQLPVGAAQLRDARRVSGVPHGAGGRGGEAAALGDSKGWEEIPSEGIRLGINSEIRAGLSVSVSLLRTEGGDSAPGPTAPAWAIFQTRLSPQNERRGWVSQGVRGRPRPLQRAQAIPITLP